MYNCAGILQYISWLIKVDILNLRKDYEMKWNASRKGMFFFSKFTAHTHTHTHTHTHGTATRRRRSAKVNISLSWVIFIFYYAFTVFYYFVFTILLLTYTFLHIIYKWRHVGRHLSYAQNGLIKFTLFPMGNIVSVFEQIGFRPGFQNEL